MIDLGQNHSQEFDPESCVLSLSSTNFSSTPDDSADETPWYEQDYQELAWWEYPDLEEDDESTKLCKAAIPMKNRSLSTDKMYVIRVESLVWTAMLKFQNVAK